MTFEENVEHAIADLKRRNIIRRNKKLNPRKTHIFGECEWILRDANGKVVKRGKQKNIVTKRGRLQSIWGAYLALGRQFYISSDERIPQFYPMDNVVGIGGTPDAFQETGSQNAGWSQATLTRSVTRTFAQPNADRTIRLIGFCQRDQFPASEGDGENITNVTTALRIDPPIVQTTANTLDIVYSVTAIPPTAKDLRRFAFPGLQLSGYYFGRWFTALATGDGMQSNLMPHTLPETFFVDGGNGYINRGNYYHNIGSVTGGAQTRFGGYTGVSQSLTIPIVDIENVGVFGMQVSGFNDSNSIASRGHMELDNSGNPVNAVMNTWPFSQGIGEIGNVFSHPVDRSYAFDEAGIVATSQGVVDVNQGKNYTPDTKIGPAHWIYRVCMAQGGDTQVGTEGKYFIARKPWVGNPYVSPMSAASGIRVDGLRKDLKGQLGSDLSAGAQGPSAIGKGDLVPDTISGSFGPADVTNSQWGAQRTAIYDGVDSWWALQRRDNAVAGRSPPEGVLKWRIGTNETFVWDTLVGDTRFVKDDGTVIGVPTNADHIGQRLTSNGAGLVFYATSDSANPTVQGGNELYAIDNSKPGRWYQRPSGDVAGASNTFTVDTDDEIHEMFPFVVGDVGKKIRIVNSVNGNSSIRTITAFNNANSVDVDGAAFNAETGMTWHWITVTEIGAAAGLATGLVYGMTYDVPNGRLWVAGENGIQLSLDNGATWSVILNESTPNTPLSNQDARDFGYPTSNFPSNSQENYPFDCIAVDNNGDLYWVDRGVNGAASGPAVDKFAMTGPGDTIGAVGGGTHTRIPLSTFPVAGTKPTNLRGLQMNLVACDLASGEGELWLHNNANESARDFYKLPLDSFVVGNITAYDPAALPGAPGGTPRTPQCGFVTPGGEVFFIGNNGGGNQGRCYYWSPALGQFIANNETSPGSFWGIENKNNGKGAYTTLPDGRTINFNANTNGDNWFGGQDQTLRYDDINDVWIQWEGSQAQFDARFGTTNGGLKKCHTAFEDILDGIQVKFTDDPGTVDPLDQFVQYESFAFPVAYGRHRTNIDQVTWTGYGFRLPSENFFEFEAIKTATGPGSLAVHFWKGDANAPYNGQDVTPPGVGGIPLLDANGKNWGWEPSQFINSRLDGAGDSPNTLGNGKGRFAAALDLGAATQVAKIRIVYAYQNNGFGWRQQADEGAQNQRRRLNVYVSNTGTGFVELAPGNEMRYPNGVGQLNGPNNQDAPNYKYVWHAMDASYIGSNAGNVDMVEFDFVAAGIAAVDRTRRYWQVTSNEVGAGVTNQTDAMMAIYAYDDAGNIIGMTSDHSLDTNQENDPEFTGCIIDEAFWIQDKPGNAPNNPTTVSTAAGPNPVDTVTVDLNMFNTANIDITRDYLAWDEGNPKGSGFLKAGDPGGAPNAARQAMARIISFTATTITVDKAVIPAGLASVNWEVRRPASITSEMPSNASPDTLAYDPITGYFKHCEANLTAGREFRVTRYGIVKTPL